MAFSTQKDFFNIPFMNERYEFGCKKACVKLKSYESTDDTRAWASDTTKQSKFLKDLVTCEYPIGAGEGDFSNTDRQVALTDNVIRSTAANVSSPGNENTSLIFEKSKHKQRNYDGTKNREKLPSDVEIVAGGDSLLECANVRLAEYQKLLKINTILEKQLEVSNDHLNTAKQENRKILEVLANKLDSSTAKDFYNKIQKFTTAGKFNKNEENEMLQIYQKMENMNKSYEILQAENNYLRRLIEKLSNRVQLENIIVQPEQSQDIDYLQKEINRLRKECLFLRQIEEDYQTSQQQHAPAMRGISAQDAENIKLIIKERNSLREKCKSFKALEEQVEQLTHETQEARKEANNLNSNLIEQTQYIGAIEEEMQNMQNHYEKEKQESRLREESLKAQLEDLKYEFLQAQCEAEKAHGLAMQNSCLRNELLQRDLRISEYDCQYKKLMNVVKELQSIKLQSIHCNQTETCTEQTDELTFYTCATLEEILREFKRRFCCENELSKIAGPKQSQKECNCEEICKDALERLKELETQNAQLLQDNQDLNGKLIEGEAKLCTMLKKLESLNEDINNNSQEAIAIGRDLEKNIALVKDLSDIQLKNQQLANAVSAINSRDDQKIIDDLRRQLEEEMTKLRECQQANANLAEEMNQRDTSLKELKELNNQLKADNDKLKNGIENPKQSSQMQENEQPTSNQQRPISVDQQKLTDHTDSDGSATSTAKQARKKKQIDTEENQLRQDRAKTKQPAGDQRKDLSLDDFVNKKSDSLKFNLLKGHSFEKEFRKILEEFILECSSQFCRSINTKSRLYIICHKLCHNGIDALNFQELAYVHKKIYNQADKLLPGCMLDMILTEHREQVESILTSVVMPRLLQSKQLNVCNDDDQKCCCCKNELCCNNSEEMLKEKVSKLEKDIVIAREYLETLKNIPLEDSLSTDNDNSTDTNNSTYRASSSKQQQKVGCSKQVKKLKARTKKQTGI